MHIDATTAAPASDIMFMNEIRAHYGRVGRPASRSFIYEAEERGDIPPSAKLGHQRVWSRKAILAKDAARFETAMTGRKANAA
jgi:predicted DNA-binding transcriptional regulator AlpA